MPDISSSMKSMQSIVDKFKGIDSVRLNIVDQLAKTSPVVPSLAERFKEISPIVEPPNLAERFKDIGPIVGRPSLAERFKEISPVVERPSLIERFKDITVARPSILDQCIDNRPVIRSSVLDQLKALDSVRPSVFERFSAITPYRSSALEQLNALESVRPSAFEQFNALTPAVRSSVFDQIKAFDSVRLSVFERFNDIRPYIGSSVFETLNGFEFARHTVFDRFIGVHWSPSPEIQFPAVEHPPSLIITPDSQFEIDFIGDDILEAFASYKLNFLAVDEWSRKALANCYAFIDKHGAFVRKYGWVMTGPALWMLKQALTAIFKHYFEMYGLDPFDTYFLN